MQSNKNKEMKEIKSKALAGMLSMQGCLCPHMSWIPIVTTRVISEAKLMRTDLNGKSYFKVYFIWILHKKINNNK